MVVSSQGLELREPNMEALVAITADDPAMFTAASLPMGLGHHPRAGTGGAQTSELADLAVSRGECGSVRGRSRVVVSRKVTIEDLCGLIDELRLRKGFFQERHVGFEPALGGEHRPSITRHEEHFDARNDPLNLLGSFLAEHLRHDDVSNEEMNVALVAAGDLDGLLSASCSKHSKPIASQDSLRYLPQSFLVLDDEHNFPLRNAMIGLCLGRHERHLGGHRQGNDDGGADSGSGSDRDMPVGGSDYPIDGG